MVRRSDDTSSGCSRLNAQVLNDARILSMSAAHADSDDDGAMEGLERSHAQRNPATDSAANTRRSDMPNPHHNLQAINLGKRTVKVNPFHQQPGIYRALRLNTRRTYA